MKWSKNGLPDVTSSKDGRPDVRSSKMATGYDVRGMKNRLGKLLVDLSILPYSLNLGGRNIYQFAPPPTRTIRPHQIPHSSPTSGGVGTTGDRIPQGSRAMSSFQDGRSDVTSSNMEDRLWGHLKWRTRWGVIQDGWRDVMSSKMADQMWRQRIKKKPGR